MSPYTVAFKINKYLLLNMMAMCQNLLVDSMYVRAASIARKSKWFCLAAPMVEMLDPKETMPQIAKPKNIYSQRMFFLTYDT